jgi:hypothetical protein
LLNTEKDRKMRRIEKERKTDTQIGRPDKTCRQADRQKDKGRESVRRG